jgi:hypothetical protein
MNKKKTVFEPNHSIHLYDLASSPLGKRLSRAGYTEDNHLDAMLHLFGMDLDYEWWEEKLDDSAQRRSDYTKDVFTGGSLFVGRKRSDNLWITNGLRNLHTLAYGDKVEQMFQIISGLSSKENAVGD